MLITTAEKMPGQSRVVVIAFVGLLALLPVSAWGAAAAQESQAIVVESFEDSDIPASISQSNAKIELVSDVGVTDGRQALKVVFQRDAAASRVELRPREPWDCSALGNCRFSLTATNLGPGSVHLHCDIAGRDGGAMKRSVSVPEGGPHTIYFELIGDRVDKDHGMRDEPPSLKGVGRKMLVGGAKWRVDYSHVKSVTLSTNDAAHDEVLILDNLKIDPNPPVVEGYLDELVDRYGQNTRVPFSEKVASDEDLQRRVREELASLESGGPLPDRSKYGGWKDGPRLEATGYFRPQKIGDRWTLVDPEGYLYFATGIDNIRMANTSTFTGVDFKDESVRYIDPEDVTPEDSLEIIPSSDAARETRFIAYPDRHRMFTWLPDYDDPLAKHYGYRRSSHKGPFDHGEVFSFYRANLERKYGSAPVEQTMAKWRDVTIDRMKNWGFTCFGNWTDASFYQMNRIPYFANGWIIGDFKTLSTGSDYWGAMPDPFDPEFTRRAEVTTQVIAEEVQGNPWCVGIFVDNEKSWGNLKSTENRYALVVNALSWDAAESPTKEAFVKILREKYPEASDLAEAWGTQVANWGEFSKGFTLPARAKLNDPEMLADFSVLMEAYADQYFRTVHDALESVLPNHIYLGCRMTTWGMTPEVWRAASRYCDVMSYNYYREALGDRVWGFLPEIDRPSIIGEWHIGATDSGNPHPGLVQASDQQDRGRMYTTYMQSVIENPYFVGAHWFQYIDSPITGRAHDGENYNAGFVTIADIPYQPLVEAARQFNQDLYPAAYGVVADSSGELNQAPERSQEAEGSQQ